MIPTKSMITRAEKKLDKGEGRHKIMIDKLKKCK